MTIMTCPRCGGDLTPHCGWNKSDETYSSACNLVRCDQCRAVGDLEGRYFPSDPDPTGFDAVIREANKLRRDVDE